MSGIRSVTIGALKKRTYNFSLKRYLHNEQKQTNKQKNASLLLI